MTAQSTAPTLPHRLASRLDEMLDELAGEPGRVVPELERIEHDARAEQLWDIVGRCRYALARAATEAGDLERALALLDATADAYVCAGDAFSATRTVLGRMHVLDNLGRFDDSIELAETTLAALVGNAPALDSPDWLWLQAALLENCAVAQGLQGLHRRSIANQQRAAAAYDNVGSIDDQRRARANLGVELLEVGQFASSISVLAAVAEEFAGDGDQWWYGVASSYLARAHLGNGSTERALEIARRSHRTLTSIGATAEALRAQLVLGSTLLATGHADEGGTVAVSVARGACVTGQDPERGHAWMLIGLAFAERGRTNAAKRSLSRAVTILEETGQARAAARARLARCDIASTVDEAEADLAAVRSRLSPDDAPLEFARVALISSRWLGPRDQLSALDQALSWCGDAAPLHLLASVETELGRALWDDGQPDRAETLLRQASRRTHRRRRLHDVARQWSSVTTPTPGAEEFLISRLAGSEATFADAFRLAESTKLPSISAQRTPHRATNGAGLAVSYRDLWDRVLGFAVDGDQVVATVEIERSSVLDAARSVDRAIEWSLKHALSPATATGLTEALAAYATAIKVDELGSAFTRGASWEARSDRLISVSGHGCVSGVPLVTPIRLDPASMIDRPSLMVETTATSPHTSTLIVDCGGDDLTSRHDEIDAITSAATNSTVARRVGSLPELARLIDRHDTIHFVGHAVAAGHRRPAAISFETWSLTERDLAELPVNGRLVVLNVCHGSAPNQASGQRLGGLASHLLAGGAEAVIGSPWPVDDSSAAVGSAAFHGAMAQGLSIVGAFEALTGALRTAHSHPLCWRGWSLRSLASRMALTKERSQ